ncbi:ligase-associated DNA damage response endonuclease PdeM [Piscinibacter sp. XHJ-5]|uniref:ligase-associated DNA damage response endonuclease PdeM n=1 Tax=Piscinibacter sp. XHJ-5 TaxID=3037797 RepID=UPI002452F567|nr:ligase-associated DNA damage response endonuclease PdeM [Piscinibacter sp. XHJ-5]
MTAIQVGGQPLTLLPERAAFLADHRTLLIADAHIGKAVSFRRWGVPVPQGTTAETLGALDRLVHRTGASRIVFLGDFLHSARSRAVSTMDAVRRWRESQPQLALTLVRGNHDRRAGDPPSAWRFEIVDEPLLLDGVALCHHPKPMPGRYVLAGHLHPCVGIGGRARDHLRLPCFHFGPQVGVLPAFGSFTGMHPIEWGEGDRVFAIADDEIAEVARR